MTTIIDKPGNIESRFINQIIELLIIGDQLNTKGLKERIVNADLISVLEDNGQILSTATLKNPLISYRNKVFKDAQVEEKKDFFKKELGYIVTNPAFEGNGYCQQLLTAFMPVINKNKLFATTRKDSVIHILSKFKFRKIGDVYKKDLNLLVYDE